HPARDQQRPGPPGAPDGCPRDGGRNGRRSFRRELLERIYRLTVFPELRVVLHRADEGARVPGHVRLPVLPGLPEVAEGGAGDVAEVPDAGADLGQARHGLAPVQRPKRIEPRTEWRGGAVLAGADVAQPLRAGRVGLELDARVRAP